MGCGIALTAIPQFTVMWSMATASIDNWSDQFHINHVVLLVKRPPRLPDAVSTDQLSTEDMIEVMHDVTPMTDVHDRSDSLQVSPAPAVTDDDETYITALTRDSVAVTMAMKSFYSSLNFRLTCDLSTMLHIGDQVAVFQSYNAVLVCDYTNTHRLREVEHNKSYVKATSISTPRSVGAVISGRCSI